MGTGKLVKVSIWTSDASGDHPKPEYVKDGRIYVEGKRGEAFGILVERLDHKNSVLEVIISVDGNNIYTFKKASYQDRGAIFLQNETQEFFDHFQIGLLLWFPFLFFESKPVGWYGGDEPTRGIIGVAIFRSKSYIPLPRDLTYQERLKRFPRQSHTPDEVIEIRYETIEDLLALGALGIQPYKPTVSYELSQREKALAFPREEKPISSALPR